MPEPKPTVIVATEHESVVRFYAGHVGNGGINQTGQFTTTRAIDPTDLANMAVDLSSTFGWLQVQPPPAPPRAVIKLAPAEPAPLPLPSANVTVPRNPNALMVCPLDTSHKVTRQNMHRHLTSSAHGLKYSQASDLMASLPRQGKAGRPKGDGVRTVAKWKQRVACPEPDCTHTCTRSNMTTHLQSQRHGWTRERANTYTATMPAIDDTPQPNLAASVRVNKPSSKSRGPQGAARLVSEVYPRIVDWLRVHGPANTREIADAINEDRPALRKYMARMQVRGLVRDVSPPGRGNNDVKVWALVD